MQQRLLDAAPDEIQEDLVQDRRGRLGQRLTGRERMHAWSFGLGLLAFAVAPPLVAASSRALPWGALIAAGLVYVVSTGIEFEVGSGSAVPAELALVPALFLLPATMVPLVAAGALLIGDLPAFVRGRLHFERAATTVAYAWYSVPPAIVVLVAGEPQPGMGSLPLLGAILVAQFAGDLVSTLLGQRIARGVSARELVRPMAWVFLVDCLLAPIGLLAAIVATDVGSPGAVLLVLPLMLLIVVFARERTARISNVLE